jgi:cyanophycinase
MSSWFFPQRAYVSIATSKKTNGPTLRYFAIATVFAVFALLHAGVSFAAQGIAVPIGGALKYDNDAVWKRLVDLAGGKGAKFAVFTTAAGEPDKSAASIIEALTRNGAIAEHIPVAPKLKTPDVRDAVRDPLLIAKVKASQGVYFAGGAQARITDALYQADGKRTPILDAIWEVFNRGGVVAGTSAGAAIMSATMFRDPPEVLDIMKHGLKEGKDIDRGLGFVGPDLFVDQHFLKRGRIGRMLPAMQQKGYKLGLGVDENSAAIIQGDEVEIIGAKGALLADLGDAVSDKAQVHFNLRNIKLTYLDRGDRYNLKTKVLTPSTQKREGKKLDHAAANFSPYFSNAAFYPDILGDTTIVNAMGNLIDNKEREVIGLAFSAAPQKNDKSPHLGFEFRLRKGAESVGYFTGAFGGEDYTVVNVYLDVTPVKMANPLYTAEQTPPRVLLPAKNKPSANRAP